MRLISLLPAAAGASAFVIPDQAMTKQLVLEHEHTVKETLSTWWDNVPNLDEIRASSEDAVNNAIDLFEHGADKLQDYLPRLDVQAVSELTGFLPEALYQPNENKGHVGKPGHHGTTNLTVYEAIQASNFTKKFAAWVDEYPDIVKELNATKTNVTIFVPTDKAFEKIPDHGHKPSKEILKNILSYHIVPGYFPAGRVLAHHTLPTDLSEAALGDRPQRLRVSAGLFGVRLNFYSKVIMVNLFCANGVAHGVDSILVPPPPAEKIISLFPSKFSTLQLAAEKTGLHQGDAKLTGLTVFAPSNWAFQKLGPKANAFLFNTEKGLKYLKALILYHVVVDETLYSDMYYGRQKDSQERLQRKSKKGEADVSSTTHYDLSTALGGKSLGVDIARYYGFITMKLNGFTRVATQDGIARDGVVHIIDSVLIPPHKHDHDKEETMYDGTEILVEDLIERLDPYIEEEADLGDLEL